MFSEENLNIIDSFMVWGRAAKQDTYTMIYNEIKVILKISSFYGMQGKAKEILKRTDYEAKRKKPVINWEDSKEKEALLNELVIDALNLSGYIKENAAKEDKDILSEAEFLEKIALQDVYLDKDGIYKMTKGTAKDRTISIIDKEMRHGHKTSSKIQDGYKTEILTGGEKGELIIGAATTAANVPDGSNMGKLLDEAKETEKKVDKIYGDTAYCDWDEIEKRTGETEFCVKVRAAVNKDDKYTKDEFNINMEAGIITCPNGETAKINKRKLKSKGKLTVGFSSKKCKNCPMREKCTGSKTGRKIIINRNEEKILAVKEYQKTKEFKNDYGKRSNVERDISHVTAHGGRQGRYKGLVKTAYQVLMACINHDIKKLMTYINNKKEDGQSRVKVCPVMG